MDILEAEMCPGAVGPLIDELPMLTTAMIRPYIIAIVLHRGAVRRSEVYAALTPHCVMDDLKVGAWSCTENDWLDCTRMEWLVDQVLGEYVSDGILRYNEETDVWVAAEDSLRFWISKATELDASLPRHLVVSAKPKYLP